MLESMIRKNLVCKKRFWDVRRDRSRCLRSKGTRFDAVNLSIDLSYHRPKRWDVGVRVWAIIMIVASSFWFQKLYINISVYLPFRSKGPKQKVPDDKLGAESITNVEFQPSAGSPSGKTTVICIFWTCEGFSQASREFQLCLNRRTESVKIETRSCADGDRGVPAAWLIVWSGFWERTPVELRNFKTLFLSVNWLFPQPPFLSLQESNNDVEFMYEADADEWRARINSHWGPRSAGLRWRWDHTEIGAFLKKPTCLAGYLHWRMRFRREGTLTNLPLIEVDSKRRITDLGWWSSDWLDYLRVWRIFLWPSSMWMISLFPSMRGLIPRTVVWGEGGVRWARVSEGRPDGSGERARCNFLRQKEKWGNKLK